MLRLILRSVAMLCILFLVASCGGGSSTPTVNIYVADAPIDNASNIVITLTEVDVTGDNGTQYFPFPIPTPLDFYSLQGGLSRFLIRLGLPDGHYTSITLHFEANPGTQQSYIAFFGDSKIYPLVIPYGQPTKFTMPVNFIVFQSISASYTIDLNLRSSILPDPNNPYQYILQPVLYPINNADAGSITGTVASTLVPSGCYPTIYIYSGKVTPTDVNVYAPAGTVQPISSALVGLNATTGLYNFTVAWLPPGNYTVAFTCQANEDEPTTTDNILFSPVISAAVSAQQTTFVSLQ
jgi:Domain of unknown function (DUF4382)